MASLSKENFPSQPKLIFMGTPQFAVPTLQALIEKGHEILAVVTQPDRPKGRGRKHVPSPVKELAAARQIKVLQPQNVSDDHFCDQMREMEPDMAIVVAFGQILKKNLLTIPGFGPDVSSKVLAAIGNPWRFENRRQVIKLAGWDLNAQRSGKKSETVTPVISKRGKAELRYALYQAAFIASSKNQYFVMYFTNKLRGREREKGIKTKMRVKLAAKLLVIAWTLMKREEPFNPDYLNLDE